LPRNWLFDFQIKIASCGFYAAAAANRAEGLRRESGFPFWTGSSRISKRLPQGREA
jgi:hypothetical protein